MLVSFRNIFAGAAAAILMTGAVAIAQSGAGHIINTPSINVGGPNVLLVIHLAVVTPAPAIMSSMFPAFERPPRTSSSAARTPRSAPIRQRLGH